ncbi:cytochrome b5-like heme/steroid binding domain-containing protein [Dipodascopsis tothii]|uniref:cytochrome b5-like heme/steroid binding domain-containing protein n=1 Tax=Dipodascopsis tothii TaxID=44089 RepID=UPI0034CF012E
MPAETVLTDATGLPPALRQRARLAVAAADARRGHIAAAERDAAAGRPAGGPGRPASAPAGPPMRPSAGQPAGRPAGASADEPAPGWLRQNAPEVARAVCSVLALYVGLSYYVFGNLFLGSDCWLMHAGHVAFVAKRALAQARVLAALRWLVVALAASAAVRAIVPDAPSLAAAVSGPDSLLGFEYPRLFSEAELARYSGAADRPVFLAINGSVYDVSAGRATYGTGGSYAFFAGRDGARAFVTGCFRSDVTHDLRGLDPDEAAAQIAGWQRFFAASPKYFYVGTVAHPPLTGPEPAPCAAARHPRGGR